jgi:hypothetical protein
MPEDFAEKYRRAFEALTRPASSADIRRQRQQVEAGDWGVANPFSSELKAFKGPEQAPAAPVAPGEPTEVEPSTGFSNDFGNRAVSEEQYERDITPKFPAIGQVKPVLLGERVNFRPAFGPEGEAGFQSMKDRVNQLDQAIYEGGEAQAKGEEAKEQFYVGEKQRQQEALAALKESQLQRQQEYQAKVEQLNQATQRYSNDLADQGKFWRNPGSILAAIGAVFLAGAGARNGDPGLGLRTIQHAIDSDFAARKTAADMHLGALRSNLEAYRQLMGDKDAGDKLAYIESQRIAAMELNRIASQFQGPLYRAKAAAISSELINNANRSLAELHMRLYQQPQFVRPEVKANILAGDKANPGSAMTFAPDEIKASQQGKKPPTWLTKELANRGDIEAPEDLDSTKPSPVLQAMRQVSGGQSTIDKMADASIKSEVGHGKPLYDERAPGTSDLVEMYKNRIAHDAMVKVGPNPTKAKLDQAALEIINKAKEDANRLAKEGQADKIASRIKGWSKFQDDLRAVAAEAAAEGMSPDQFFHDIMYSASPGTSNKLESLKQIYGSQNTPEARQAMERLNKIQRFRQMLATKKVDFYHERGGVALNQAELDAFGEVIASNAPFSKWMGFADNMSNTAANDYSGVLAQAGPIAGSLLQIRYGLRNPGLNRPGIQKSNK